MNIITSKSFDKAFIKLDTRTQQRIAGAVDKLPLGDVKKLHGVHTTPPSYRLRVGKYRVLFRMNDEDAYLDKLDSRGDVYKN